MAKRQGWHGERQAHGLCAKGIKVRKPKVKAGVSERISVKDNIFLLFSDKVGVASASRDIQRTVDSTVKAMNKLLKDYKKYGIKRDVLLSELYKTYSYEHIPDMKNLLRDEDTYWELSKKEKHNLSFPLFKQGVAIDKKLDKYVEFGANDTASREAIIEYIDSKVKKVN